MKDVVNSTLLSFPFDQRSDTTSKRKQGSEIKLMQPATGTTGNQQEGARARATLLPVPPHQLHWHRCVPPRHAAEEKCNSVCALSVRPTAVRGLGTPCLAVKTSLWWSPIQHQESGRYFGVPVRTGYTETGRLPSRNAQLVPVVALILSKMTSRAVVLTA